MHDPRPVPSERLDPDPSRFSPARDDQVEVCARHRAAVARGADTYADPRTGRLVFTASALWARAACCKLGCRHCPYGEPRGEAR